MLDGVAFSPGAFGRIGARFGGGGRGAEKLPCGGGADFPALCREHAAGSGASSDGEATSGPGGNPQR